MQEYLPQIFGLAAGALGGNVAGGLMKSGMGTLGRSLTGIVGGTGLAFLAPMIPGLDGMFAAPADAAEGGMNAKAAVAGLVSGGVGGGLLTAILGKVMK
ncbi:MAG: hypothetical protein HKN36_10630 [Hellea sp.]|nr:hypothetical protein [Hellea sp.]